MVESITRAAGFLCLPKQARPVVIPPDFARPRKLEVEARSAPILSRSMTATVVQRQNRGRSPMIGLLGVPGGGIQHRKDPRQASDERMAA